MQTLLSIPSSLYAFASLREMFLSPYFSVPPCLFYFKTGVVVFPERLGYYEREDFDHTSGNGADKLEEKRLERQEKPGDTQVPLEKTESGKAVVAERQTSSAPCLHQIDVLRGVAILLVLPVS